MNARPGADVARAAYEARSAWRAAIVAAALVVVGELGFAVIDAVVIGIPGPLVPLRLLHAATALAVIAALLAGRRAPATATSVGAYLAVMVPLFPMFWFAEEQLAALGILWSPFIGHKIAMVGFALLTPGPIALGAALVAALGLQAVAQWHQLALGARAEVIAAGEPWGTVVYALVAVGVLVYRAHHRAIEREYARARAEAEVLERLARVLLAVRDRANTPLQTLEVGTEVLARRAPAESRTVGRMKGALARLREIARFLASADRYLRWRYPDASLDAEAVLRDLERAWARDDGGAPRRRATAG